jgi:Protein of unknown function (DUF2934)
MAKTAVSKAAKAAGAKPKPAREAAPPVTTGAAPAIEVALPVDEDRIRERAYSIWIAEGRPDGREHAHWQQARHELQLEGRARPQSG